MGAKKSVIVTGVTGMVGEGVLHECLHSPDIERVLVIGRKPCGVSHPKLSEIVHHDLFDLDRYKEQLTPYDACFFCLGVSSVGMSEADYTKISYELTIYVGELLADLNHDLVFCYVSGSGTDSSESGKSMWARVKGKTENQLLKLPFKRAYMFRPGYIHPTKGLKNTHRYYHAITWMYPILRLLLPNHAITLRELGQAMIRTATVGYDSSIIDSNDIRRLAKGE